MELSKYTMFPNQRLLADGWAAAKYQADSLLEINCCLQNIFQQYTVFVDKEVYLSIFTIIAICSDKEETVYINF